MSAKNKREMCQLKKKVYFNTFPTMTTVHNHSCLDQLISTNFPIKMVGKVLVRIDGLSACYMADKMIIMTIVSK